MFEKYLASYSEFYPFVSAERSSSDGPVHPCIHGCLSIGLSLLISSLQNPAPLSVFPVPPSRPLPLAPSSSQTFRLLDCCGSSVAAHFTPCIFASLVVLASSATVLGALRSAVIASLLSLATSRASYSLPSQALQTVFVVEIVMHYRAPITCQMTVGHRANQ